MVAMDTIKEQAPSETGPNQARPGGHREHCLFVGGTIVVDVLKKKPYLQIKNAHLIRDTHSGEPATFHILRTGSPQRSHGVVTRSHSEHNVRHL